MPERWSGFDLVEAFQLAHAVKALHDLDLFKELQIPTTAKQLSEKYDVDLDLLTGMLEYVSVCTDLLRKSGKRWTTTSTYSNELRFLLDLYAGAYGSNARQLAKLLKNPSAAPRAVDRAGHARAFRDVDGSQLGFLPELIRQLGFNYVLDLGCGNAALLIALAQRRSDFIGWGLELNREMVKVARANIRAAGKDKQVRIMEGDCRNLRPAVVAKLRSRVKALTACNVANEMFAGGSSGVIEWLRDMGKLFHARPLLIADYYGRLGNTKGSIGKGKGRIRKGNERQLAGKKEGDAAERNERQLAGKKEEDAAERNERQTLLHDYVQLISGQGVPPGNLSEWRSIYKHAGCHLVHVIEDKTTTRFIHIIQLNENGPSQSRDGSSSEEQLTPDQYTIR